MSNRCIYDQVRRAFQGIIIQTVYKSKFFEVVCLNETKSTHLEVDVCLKSHLFFRIKMETNEDI